MEDAVIHNEIDYTHQDADDGCHASPLPEKEGEKQNEEYRIKKYVGCRECTACYYLGHIQILTDGQRSFSLKNGTAEYSSD